MVKVKEAVQKEEPKELMVVDMDVVSNPQKTMDNAVRVAKLLDDIVSKSKNKSIIVVNKQRYLMFPAWQTIAQFYGFIVQTDWTKRLEKDGKFLGYEAKALLINVRTGQTYPGAEAMCLASENNWYGKPEFTLRSMAQTRACSKTLSNMLRGVATLAGYEGTPGEEIADAVVTENKEETPAKTETQEESKETDTRPATARQLAYIKKNFSWKKLDLAEFENKFKPLSEVSLEEAKNILDFLFKHKEPTLPEVLAVVGK
jgi:hypothetical protein